MSSSYQNNLLQIKIRLHIINPFPGPCIGGNFVHQISLLYVPMCGFRLTTIGQIHSQNLIHQLLHEIDNPISRCSHMSWYDHFQFEHQDEEGLPVEELKQVGRATLP